MSCCIQDAVPEEDMQQKLIESIQKSDFTTFYDLDMPEYPHIELSIYGGILRAYPEIPGQTPNDMLIHVMTYSMQDAVPEEDMQQELMETIQKGNFTMRILYEQLGNILKMGPMGQMMNMIPGFGNSGLFTKVGDFCMHAVTVRTKIES